MVRQCSPVAVTAAVASVDPATAAATVIAVAVANTLLNYLEGGANLTQMVQQTTLY